MTPGKAVAFGLDGLQERAEMFIAPGEEVYEGMIVGENSRTGDMPVNPTKEKKLTNMRASGSDRNIILKPPRVLSLEEALEYIEEDELVEVTPSKVRLRKILLLETDRRRAARQRAVSCAAAIFSRTPARTCALQALRSRGAARLARGAVCRLCSRRRPSSIRPRPRSPAAPG